MNEREALDWFREAGESELGKFGESAWRNIFQFAGINFIPLCNIQDGGAPLMHGQVKTILPDFDVSTNRFNAYVDSKCKRKSVMYWKAKEVRHGIDRRNWQHYVSISEFNRKRCLLGIIELFDDSEHWSGSVLAQSLSILGSPISGFSNQSHMVYWPRNKFRLLAERIPPIDFITARSKMSASVAMPTRLRFPVELLELLGAKERIQQSLF